MKKVIMMLLSIAVVTAVQAAPSVKITTADGSSTAALVAKVDYMTPTAFKVVLSERPSPDNHTVRVALNPKFFRGETPVELAEIDPKDARYIVISTDDKIDPTDEYGDKEVELEVGELETTFYVYTLGRPADLEITHLRFSPSFDNPDDQMFYSGKRSHCDCTLSDVAPTITDFKLPVTSGDPVFNPGDNVNVQLTIEDNWRDASDYYGDGYYAVKISLDGETIHEMPTYVYDEGGSKYFDVEPLYVRKSEEGDGYEGYLNFALPGTITNNMTGVFSLQDPYQVATSSETNTVATTRTFQVVPFIDSDQASKVIVNPEIVTAETATFEDKKWYVVTNTIARGAIKVNGAAHLILCDGASLKVTGGVKEAGIEVPADKSLTIYGQSEGTGKLEASSAMLGAGIGGSSQGSCGAITINGGTIKATGGAGGAGIGGGDRGKCGTVTINGGEITASTEYADAIGSGFNAKDAATVIFGTAMASKYVWAGASATVGEAMTTAAFSSDHSADYVEVPTEIYTVAYDKNGAAGVMTNSIFAVGKDSTLKANAYSAVGYDFAGWTLGTNTTVIADSATVKDLASVDGSATLTAKWNATGVSIDAFDVLTNTLVVVTNQAASLPVKITLSGEIAVPQDGVITVNASPAITFAGEGMLDVSAIVPTFGTSSVVGEGFTSTNAPALFDTKGVSKLVYEEGTISLIARGESEEFPWILDASTNVTAWVESSNLVIDNGLTANSYDIDLVAMTNNFATYSYTPASPLNAKVKIGEGDYKTPTCWIGESDSYETLGAALEAGETTVLPGYEVVYAANGAAGSMTNSYFAAATEATLKANEFSAVGYDFAGWTLGTNTTVIADSATVKDLASVDGSATLTAQWSLNADGVTEVSFEALTNTIATAGLQKTNLPITIDFTSEVVIPTNAVLSAFPSGTGFSGIRYVPEEEGYSTLSVSNDVLYASTVREEVTVDALVLMQHAMGGSIPELLALTTDEAGATIATNIVMFVGDNHKAYFNDDDNVDQMIADVLAADPRPTTLKLYEVKGAIVTFEAMGGLIEAGVDPLGNAYEGGVETITYLCLPDPGYELPEVSRADYTLIGWYDGWTNGVNAVTNHQEIVNYSEHSLYAKWQSTKIHPSETPGEKIIETKTGEDGTIVRPSDTSALPAELILPETDTGAAEGTPLTKIDEKAYAGLPGITKVALPIYVKEVGARAFYNEKNLGEVVFVQPRDYETLDKVPLTIGGYAFSGTKIEKVRIPSMTTVIGSAAFANCPNLKEVELLGAPTIEGVYPFRNCGSAEDPLTITLAPRAAADQAFINSLTNGCNNVIINEKYAGEITATAIRVDQPEVGKLEIDFTYSANDVDINVDTVTAVTAASLGETGVTAKDPMIPLEIRVNGSNSYTAVFTKPSGASGFFRLTVNIEK